MLGIAKTLLLEAKSELSDQRLGSTDPATQTLEVEALPIMPLWLRFMPLQNDRVAVGLDNGVIELRDVPSGTKISELQDLKHPKAKGDRVFDLAFTLNSLNLFSGYGSGKVRPASNRTASE